MEPNCSTFEKNGTTYFKYEVPPACIRPWPKIAHPLVPQGRARDVYFCDCLRMICEQPKYSEAQIIEKLNQLYDIDAHLFWDQIQGLFIETDRTEVISQLLQLTASVCQFFARSRHAQIADQLWEQRKTRLPIPHLDRLSPDLVRWIAEQILAENPLAQDLSLLDAWGEPPVFMKLPKILLLEKEERRLNLAHIILEKAPEYIDKEFSDKQKEEALSTLDSYWICYNYLWIDLKGTHALPFIGENGRLDANLLVKILDIAAAGEAGFYLVAQNELTDPCITVLENMGKDEEPLSYFFNQPQFLQWLRKIEMEVVYPDSFVQRFLDKILELPLSEQPEKLEIYKDIFLNSLPERFFDHYLDFNLRRLVQLEKEKKIEESLIKILTGLCTFRSLPAASDKLGQVCEKISALAMRRKIKIDSIRPRWLKVTSQLQDGQVYGLDRAIADGFGKGFPKDLQQPALVLFISRLAGDDPTRLNAIKLMARLVLNADKRKPIQMPAGLIRRFAQIKSPQQQEGVVDLLKSFGAICSYLHTMKDVKQKENGELKELFIALLTLITNHEKTAIAQLKDNFWSSCVALGTELGIWNRWIWRGMIREIEERLIVLEFETDQSRVRRGHQDAGAVREILTRQIRTALLHPELLKEKMVALLADRLKRLLVKNEAEMLKMMGDILAGEAALELLNEQKHQELIKGDLVQLIRTLYRSSFERAAVVPSAIVQPWDLSAGPAWRYYDEKGAQTLGAINSMEIALRIAESYSYLYVHLWEALFSKALIRIEDEMEISEDKCREIFNLIGRFETYLSENEYKIEEDCFDAARLTMFAVGLRACAGSIAVPVEQVVKLRNLLKIEMDKNHVTELARGLDRYMELLDQHKTALPADEIEAVYVLCEFLLDKRALALSRMKDFSTIDFQIRFLSILHACRREGFVYHFMWMAVLTNKTKSKKESEIVKLLTDFCKDPKEEVRATLKGVLEALVEKVKKDPFNPERVLKLLDIWFKQDDETYFTKIKDLFDALIKHSYQKGWQPPKELFTEVVKELYSFVAISENQKDQADALNLIGGILGSNALSKALTEEVRIDLFESFVTEINILITSDYQYYSDVIIEINKAFTAAAAPINILGSPLNASLFERKEFIAEFLSAEIVPKHANLSDVFSVGIESFALLLSLLDPHAATPYIHATKLEVSIFPHIKWDEIEETVVHIPFNGELQTLFSSQYIHSLMDMDFAGEEMSLVMVMYIWELIKGFSKQYPNKLDEIEELYLKFFFLPQNLDVLDQRLHWALCYAWYKTGITQKLNPKTKAKLEFLLSVHTDVEKLLKEKNDIAELTKFFHTKALLNPTLFLIHSALVLYAKFDQKKEGGCSVALATALVAQLLKREFEVPILNYIFKHFPPLLNIAYRFALANGSFNDLERTKVAGSIAIFYHHAIKGMEDGETKSKCINCIEVCLGEPLKRGWVVAEDPVYQRILAIINADNK